MIPAWQRYNWLIYIQSFNYCYFILHFVSYSRTSIVGQGTTGFSIWDTPTPYLHFCIGTCSCYLLYCHLRLWNTKGNLHLVLSEQIVAVFFNFSKIILLQMRQWKAWEDETKTVEYQYYNGECNFSKINFIVKINQHNYLSICILILSLLIVDPDRFRFARETSFGRRHLHFWSRSPILLWIVRHLFSSKICMHFLYFNLCFDGQVCFFRQFFPSVAKVDYLTLRHGFVTVSCFHI